MESRFWHRRDVRPFVCPSVPPLQNEFLPSDFQNYFFVGKVGHQIPIFCYFRLSVRLHIRMDWQTKSSVFVESCSSSPILKMLFLLERHKISIFNTLCPTVCTYGWTDRQNRPNTNFVLTDRFSKFLFCLKGRLTPDTYNLYLTYCVRLSVWFSVRLS